MPIRLFATVALLIASASLAQQPNAITNDPEPNPSAPTQNIETVMDSHGSRIMGVFLLASSTQPHPTVILLHGFPGYEQNIDLAQSLRRDGWNVLAMHYRGDGVRREASASPIAWKTSRPCWPTSRSLPT
jgi:predicted alpha/beta-fold hydrolase